MLLISVVFGSCMSRTPSCHFLYGTTFWTFSVRLNGNLKTSTLKILSVSSCWRTWGTGTRIPALIVQCWLTTGVCWLMNCPCANITVRREIDSLNERLTGDGQPVEGGDPSKGVLKTKGALFSPQTSFVELANAPIFVGFNGLCGVKMQLHCYS